MSNWPGVVSLTLLLIGFIGLNMEIARLKKRIRELEAVER